MRTRCTTLRLPALVVAAALALHQLRYLVGYGGGSGEALAHQGHGYLMFAEMAAGVLLALGAGLLLTRISAARRTGTSEAAPRSFTALWLGAAATLLAVYAVQELLEGLGASGHPEGLAALVGHGGLVAVPLALVLGAFVALFVRGAHALVAAAAARGSRAGVRRAPLQPAPRETRKVPRTSVLARHMAGRAPPALA
jgi:hypothetical protein